MDDPYFIFLKLYRVCLHDPVILFIDAYKLYIVPVNIIKCYSAQDIVHHGLTEHIISEHILYTEPLNLPGLDSPEIHFVFICKKLFKGFYRHWFVKIIPLCIDTSHIQEKIHLFLCLNPFCDHADSHQPCHTRYGFQYTHSPVCALLIHIQELHVYFKNVHIDIL